MRSLSQKLVLLGCTFWTPIAWAAPDRTEATPPTDSSSPGSQERRPAAQRREGAGRRVTWRKFSWTDFGATAALTAAYYTVEFSLPIPTGADWTGPLPYIDEPARATVVGSTRDQRMRAHRLSNYFWMASIAMPVLDAALIPLARRAELRMIWELEWMNLQEFVLSSLVTRVPHKLIGRERPNALGCADDPLYDDQCGRSIQYQSFPGGHTSISMTGAGLSCAHHLHAQLYGNPVADGLACGGALTVGTLVAYWRLRADRHWLSDNVVGAALGLGVGYAVPTLFYYRPFWEKARSRHGEPRAKAPLAFVLPTRTGALMGVVGTF